MSVIRVDKQVLDRAAMPKAQIQKWSVQWAVMPGWTRMPNFSLWTSLYCWFSSLFAVRTWLDEYLRLTGCLSIMTSAWLQQQWWAALGRHHHPLERDPWRVYDPFESWSSITVLTLREPIVWNTCSVSLSDVLRIPWKPRSPTVCKTQSELSRRPRDWNYIIATCHSHVC